MEFSRDVALAFDLAHLLALFKRFFSFVEKNTFHPRRQSSYNPELKSYGN
jgi:hypothetical protein